MNTAVQGVDKILMFRMLKDAASQKAAKLALQTKHTLKYDRKTNTTQTKDGALNSTDGLETKLTIEAVATRDELNLMLEKSVIDGEVVEIWEIDYGAGPVASGPNAGKYQALYMQGLLGSWEAPSNVGEFTTISTEAVINGKPQEGFATVTEEQQEEIQYAFKDVAVEIPTP